MTTLFSKGDLSKCGAFKPKCLLLFRIRIIGRFYSKFFTFLESLPFIPDILHQLSDLFKTKYPSTPKWYKMLPRGRRV